ncbi:exopolysaccharide biosynthesis polyprenyl glycosylphosphotransferase [Solidesulfovibrio sp.]
MLFVSLEVILVNVFEVLTIFGIHLSQRNGHRSAEGNGRLGSIRKLFSRHREILLADVIVIVLFWLIFRAQTMPLLFIFLYLALSSPLVAAFRFLLSRLLHSGLWRHTTLNLLIVGANARGEELYKESLSFPFLGFSVVGFVDDADHTGGNITLLGGLNDLVSILREKVVDVLVVCLPIRSHYDATITAMHAAESQGISCESLGSFFPINACKMGEDAVGRAILTTCALPRGRSMFKRQFDLAAASILLLVFCPFMLLAALRIKLEDGGPVFYTQPRVGLNKRIFNLYKFRSMVVDAEQRQPYLERANEMDGPVFKIARDPRVTKIGRWLRKYNIDEMPQLLNVLRGEMSVVGPRPMSLRDYGRLTEDWTRRRFTLKPGLTCYWQTMPHRNSMSFSEWMTLDMRYVEDYSLWEDVVICLKTIPAMLRGSGV